MRNGSDACCGACVSRSRAQPRAAPRVEDLIGLLAKLTDERTQVHRAFVLWIDLVEALIQECERREGAAPGAYKANQVKAALIHLWIKEKVDLPNVPRFLEPLLIDVVISWVIDAIVLLLNRHDLWELEEHSPEWPGGGFVTAILLWLSKPFMAVGDWSARIGQRRVSRKHRLSPEVKSAVEVIAREAPDSPYLLLSAGLGLVEWLGRHRRQVIAFIDVVSVATQEAEGFLEMSGHEKKQYARTLIFVLLEEDGFTFARFSFTSAIIDLGIDFAVDAVVRLFHKRNLFEHRRQVLRPCKVVLGPGKLFP